MVIDQRRLIVRYYFFLIRLFIDGPGGSGYAVRSRLANGTSLCAFVWTVILFTLFLMFLGVAALFGAVLVISLTVIIPLSISWFALLLVWASIGGCILFAAFIVRRVQRGSFKQSVTIAYVKAVKQRVCPLVKFESRETAH